jgi:regulator of nonsense transcripts 2
VQFYSICFHFIGTRTYSQRSDGFDFFQRSHTHANAAKAADAEKEREKQEVERVKKEQEAAAEASRMEELKMKQEAELQRQREEKERQEREEAEKVRQEEIKKRREFLFQRSLNIRADATRPNASFFKQLDSSIKKNSAFIKKIQAKISDDNKDSLVKEIRQLNLTRYVSELAAAVAQVPLKVSDIEPTVKVCSVIHQLYADFTPQLVPALSKALSAATQSDKEEAMARRRLLLRLICDLFIYGVFTDESVVMSALKELLTTKDKPSQMLTLVISFVRSAGIEILSMIPRGQKKPISIAELVASSGGSASSTPNVARASNNNRGNKPSGTEADDELFSAVSTEASAPRNSAPVAMEEWESDPLVVEILSSEKSQPFVSVIEKFFDKMCQYMLKEYASLRKIEKANHELLITKGEVSQSGQEEYEKQKQSFFKLQNNMIQLAELMDKDLPELPDEDKTTRVVSQSSENTGATGDSGASADADTGTEESLWDDEDTKILYETLPDLKDMVPLVLLGINPTASSPAQTASTEENAAAPVVDAAAGTPPVDSVTTKDKEADKETTIAPETSTTPVPAPVPAPATATAATPTPVATSAPAPAPAAAAATPSTVPTESSGSTASSDSSSSSLANTAASDKLTLFLQQLNKCVNRDMIDQAAVDFAYINNRGNRSRVVKHMFTVPRTRLDALPYYSRFIATWYPFAKDMGKELIGKLEEEFKQLYAQKDQINIETKVKNIRFLCELVKFKLCPTNTIFNCLKMCIDDFKHHNVDVACSLIETCGRFLYRQPETRTRMNTLLEIMMQVKAARNFSPSVELAVENAYYFCKPSDRPSFAGKQRAPMHECSPLFFNSLTTHSSHIAYPQIFDANFSLRPAKTTLRLFFAE